MLRLVISHTTTLVWSSVQSISEWFAKMANGRMAWCHYILAWYCYLLLSHTIYYYILPFWTTTLASTVYTHTIIYCIVLRKINGSINSQLTSFWALVSCWCTVTVAPEYAEYVTQHRPCEVNIQRWFMSHWRWLKLFWKVLYSFHSLEYNVVCSHIQHNVSPTYDGKHMIIHFSNTVFKWSIT